MHHLHRVSTHGAATGMNSRNLSIVWAPNLIRPDHGGDGAAADGEKSGGGGGGGDFQSGLVRNTRIVQYLIDNARWLFEAQVPGKEAQSFCQYEFDSKLISSRLRGSCPTTETSSSEEAGHEEWS